jgi:L-ascorbate metabolism protein UlaG (beta-lactamase superfamily)
MLGQEEQRRPSIRRLVFGDHPVEDAPVRPDPKSWDDSTITAAWIGHATVLINLFGTTIITDPVFSERIGINILGAFTIGPKRLVTPALTIDELPEIDLILLSHAHMDHMDFPSLRKFDKSIPVVMAKNTSDLLVQRGWRHFQELDWGESTSLCGVTVEALRVNHFGWRFPWEKDRSRGNWDGRSYNAYLISKNGKYILFGGDSAYQEYYRALGEQNVPIDLAILAIGAYDPWIRVHANPEQAVAMANHMKAKSILPIHWGTFTLSSEPVNEPIERLKKAVAEHSPQLALEKIGETWKMKA